MVIFEMVEFIGIFVIGCSEIQVEDDFVVGLQFGKFGYGQLIGFIKYFVGFVELFVFGQFFGFGVFCVDMFEEMVGCCVDFGGCEKVFY